MLMNPGVTGTSGHAQSLTGISRRSKPRFGQVVSFLGNTGKWEPTLVVGNGCGHNKPSVCSVTQ